MKLKPRLLLRTIFLISLFAAMYIDVAGEGVPSAAPSRLVETALLSQADQQEAIDIMIDANSRFTVPSTVLSWTGQVARTNCNVRSVGSCCESPEQDFFDRSFDIKLKTVNSASRHHISPTRVKTMHLYSLGRIVI